MLDSSSCFECFTDSKRVALFSKPIEDTKNLIVSVIIIYEVYKKLLFELDENIALTAVELR